MQWKNPNCYTLLVLPRPYPQYLYPESLLEPEKQKIYTLDLMMRSMLRPIPSGRLLHIIEVDKDFEIEGVQTYNKCVFFKVIKCNPHFRSMKFSPMGKIVEAQYRIQT